MPTSVPADSPIVLFDGVCNLCTASVRFILRRDRTARFRFAALQSSAGRRLLESHQLPPGKLDTIVLVENGRVYARSTAALRIARRLAFPWPLCYAMMIVPRFLRDAVYDFIAHRRYRWFGRRDECMLPTPELEQRFLH